MTIDGFRHLRFWHGACPASWHKIYLVAWLALCPANAAIARDFDLLGAAANAELVASSPWQPPIIADAEIVDAETAISTEPTTAIEIPAQEGPSEPWQPPVEMPIEAPEQTTADPPSEPIAEVQLEPVAAVETINASETIVATQPINVAEPILVEPATKPSVELAAPVVQPATEEPITEPSSLATTEAQTPENPENEEYLAALDVDLTQSFVAHTTAPLPVLHAPLPSTAFEIEARVEMQLPAPVATQVVVPMVTPYSPTTADLTRQLLPSIQRAYALARHGAIFAARTEFIQVLRRIAQSKDAAASSDIHSHSLAAALRALDEADDFAPHGAQLEGEMDVTLVSAAHRTPVLDECPAPPRPVEAIALYHEYARHQFARAVAGEQAGSAALYGLGKMHNRLANGNDGDVGQERKALVLFLAALDVAPGNHLAANEVGVLFARGGRPWEASIIFRHSIDVAPSATTYHNLAVVDHQLGYHEQASANELYAQQLAARDRAAGAASQANGVRWIAPQDMSRMAQPLPIEANQNWAQNRQRPMPQQRPAGQFETAAPRAAQWPQKLIPGVFRR